MTTEPTPPAVVLSAAQLERFEAWWAAHGQFCSAGGGQYEKTFAYRAFEYAETAAILAEREACARVCEVVHVRPIQGAHEEYMVGKEMALQQAARAIRMRSNVEVSGAVGIQSTET